ncbi:MAG: hypothetical protein Q3990_10215 [Desulfovibrionaceae bacterium]|nr:hypothetical protein [Desulfovibrionaceae bacterium]
MLDGDVLLPVCKSHFRGKDYRKKYGLMALQGNGELLFGDIALKEIAGKERRMI